MYLLLKIYGMLMLCTNVSPLMLKPCGDEKGTQFLVVFMENKHNTFSRSLSITNTDERNVQVNISTPRWPGTDGVDLSLRLQANESTSIEFDEQFQLNNSDNWSDKTVLVSSDGLIKCVSFNLAGSSYGAYTVYSASVLGTKYIAITSDPQTHTGDKAQIAVTTYLDSTTVKMTLPEHSEATVDVDGVAYHSQNVIYTGDLIDGPNIIQITLNSYQVFHISSYQELTGIVIESDKPIAALSGNRVTRIGPGGRVDHICEQLQPTAYWGKSFVTAPIADSEREEVHKIVSGSSNTDISVTTSNATFEVTLQSVGEVYTFTAPVGSSVLVEASAPVMFVQFTVGREIISRDDWYDSFMLVVAPLEQYQSKLILTTYTNHSDTHDTVTLFTSDDKKTLIDIDGVVLSNSHTWYSVNGSNMVYTQVPLDDGSYVITSPFASAKLWGYLYGGIRTGTYGYSVGCRFCGIPVTQVSENFMGSYFEMTLTDQSPGSEHEPLLTMKSTLRQCFLSCMKRTDCNVLTYSDVTDTSNCKLYSGNVLYYTFEHHQGHSVYERSVLV